MKSINNISIAIVIPTLNRERVLLDTVDSVLKLDPLPDEIFVIDQSVNHEPDTENYLQKIKDFGVTVVRLPKPGVCFARNLGAALSNSDIIIYLDDDVIIEDPAFIEKHRRNYNNTEITAVQGQILLPDISIKDASIGSRNCINMFEYRTRLENISTFVTAHVSIRRSVLLQTGGFDEGFSGRTYANEDGDFGLRLFKSGYRIDFDPAVNLIHLRTPSGGNRLVGRDVFSEWTRSVTFFQFFLRHYKGWLRIWKILTVFSLIAFRKENVMGPWRIPGALLHSLYAFNLAIKRHRVGFRSSIFNPGIDYLRQKFLAGSTR